MEVIVPMIGNFKLKRISKTTGESEVILEERNQTAAGFATAIVDILTGAGSNDLRDYKFRYFQLGNQKYDKGFTPDMIAGNNQNVISSFT